MRIYGLQDKNRFEAAEETALLVTSLVKNKLSLDVSVAGIDIAHRLGPFRVDGNMPVICKFLSRNMKNTVTHARSNLKGISIVIRDIA